MLRTSFLLIQIVKSARILIMSRFDLGNVITSFYYDLTLMYYHPEDRTLMTKYSKTITSILKMLHQKH